MKKIIPLVIIIVVIGFVIINFQNSPTPSITSNNLPITATENQVELDVNDQKIMAAWFKTMASKIKLYPNFEEQLTASQAVVKYSCKSLVNGGFYSKENKPLGLFVADGKTIQNYISSNLFNGFFVVNNSTAQITHTIPQSPNLAIQTGPVLFENSNEANLRITNDKFARRMVAAINSKNEVVFIVFYNANSVFNGPYLADMPEAISRFQEKTNEKIVSAINLDGGAASVFADEEIFLNELSPVGSFLCIN